MNELEGNKIENLKKLKQLLDDKAISEKEYAQLKNEILPKHKEEISSLTNSNNKNNKGLITLKFKGQWFLFDAKTKLFVNGQLHSIHSTKKGFTAAIPVDSEKITLKVVLAGIKSTEFKMEELVLGKNYLMELKYDTAWGRYSTTYKFSENG